MMLSRTAVPVRTHKCAVLMYALKWTGNGAYTGYLLWLARSEKRYLPVGVYSRVKWMSPVHAFICKQLPVNLLV